MINCASLYTCELDSPETALKELLSQLNEKSSLKSNTMGIVMCHTEFIDSGVLDHIAKGLPFDVVGLTTSSQSVNEIADDMILTVFVMTSDDVKIILGSASVENISEADGNLVNAISKISENTNEKPGLILTFPPLLHDYSGDDCVETWTKIFPGVPVAGGMPSTDIDGIVGSKIYYNGSVHDRLHAFLLFYGPINPRFIGATFPEKSKYPYSGTITKSKGNMVYEINGQGVWDYMQKIGVIDEQGTPYGINGSVPFMINHHEREDYDGVSVLRGITNVSKECMTFFSGSLDKGSTITMLNITPEDTLLAAETELDKIINWDGISGVLVFSCIMRYTTLLSVDALGELNLIKNRLGNVPFMAGYVGGEFCPTSKSPTGEFTNRFHNYSLAAVVLQ